MAVAWKTLIIIITRRGGARRTPADTLNEGVQSNDAAATWSIFFYKSDERAQCGYGSTEGRNYNGFGVGTVRTAVSYEYRPFFAFVQGGGSHPKPLFWRLLENPSFLT